MPTFKRLISELNSWTSANVQWAHAKLRSNSSAYRSARTIGIALLVLALVIGLGIAFAVSRSIKGGVDTVLDRLQTLQDKCMTFLREGMEAFAEGDLTQRYEPVTPLIDNPLKDEIGQVADAVNGMRERIVASLGHRGGARRRTGSRLRRGGRGGAQAGRGVPAGGRGDLHADRRDAG